MTTVLRSEENLACILLMESMTWTALKRLKIYFFARGLISAYFLPDVHLHGQKVAECS